jgi:hypothetical protein
MTCCAETEVHIEDPRHHSTETVVSLRTLLSKGTTIIPDPKRLGFYEVSNDSTVYYIHISPVNGNIVLLATWPSAEDAAAGQAS